MKRRYVEAWLRRHLGVMAEMAREQGTSKQNVQQIVKRAGLLDFARELRQTVLKAERLRLRQEKKERRLERIRRAWQKAAERKAEKKREKKERQRRDLLEAIVRCGGNEGRIAHELGVVRTTVVHWVKEFGLREEVVRARRERRQRGGA